MTSQLSDNKKLTIIFRVEPGCLGPKGADLIDDFCAYSNSHIQDFETEIINWDIVPRLDKSLEEMQYMLNDKRLSEDKAQRYLNMLNKEIGEFEERLHEKIADLIDQFSNR